MTPAPDSNTPNTPLSERLAYKPAEAAAILGIGRNKVFELLRDQSLGSVKYGRTRLIPKAAIERFLAVEDAA